MKHRFRTIISLSILLPLLPQSTSDPPPLPLLCLEYLYEANIDRGDLVYILRDDALLQDRFFALATTRANIMVASWDDRRDRQRPGAHGSFRHGFNRETHYVMVFRGIAELEGELGFLKNHSRFDSRSWFLVVFLDEVKGCGERSGAVAAVFELLWSRFYIHNTVLMYCPVGVTSEECFVYTWFPYGRYSSCATNFFNYDQIDRCSLVEGELNVQYLNGAVNISEDNSTSCSSHYPNEAFFTPTRVKWHNFSIPTVKSAIPTGTFELRSAGHPPSQLPTTRKRAFLRHALTKRPADFHPSMGLLISPEDPHFFHKVPHDLGGCPVRALVAVWPPMVTDPGRTDWVGMEQKLVLDVARFMNVRLEEELLDVNRSGRMAGVKVIEEFRVGLMGSTNQQIN